MVLFLFSVLLVSTSAVFLVRKMTLVDRWDKVLAFYVMANAAVILSMELSGLIHQFGSPWMLLGIQAGFLLITILFKGEKGNPASQPGKRFDLWQWIRSSPFQTVYISLLGLLYGFLAFLAVRIPQNTTDALYNHLARIGYWLQQGSLLPYEGFNRVAMTYPYNNSLLMAWPIVFLRIDKLVALVQFVAALALALTIIQFAKRLGYSSKTALISGLVFLTFPIVVLQAITAQNDLLAASFGLLAIYFAYRAGESRRNFLVSAIAMALALGTKQYTFTLLPVYLLLLWIRFGKSKQPAEVSISRCISILVVSVLLFGSYAYIQNLVTTRSLFGDPNVTKVEGGNRFVEKVTVNSARLAIHSIDGQGLPPAVENLFNQTREKILRPIIEALGINVEGSDYLHEKDSPFTFNQPPGKNEENSWFGPLSWSIILASLIVALVLLRKSPDKAWLLLIVAALLHFVGIAIVYQGWNEYQGRYLTISVALLMPITAGFFELLQKKTTGRVLTGAILLVGLLVAGISLVNNISKPLINHVQIQKFFQAARAKSYWQGRIVFEFIPWVQNDNQVWDMTDDEIRTYGVRDFIPAFNLVNKYVPADGSLDIAGPTDFFPDYLFFGENFTRKIKPVVVYSKETKNDPYSEFILVSPRIKYNNPTVTEVDSSDGWILYRKE